MSEHAHDILFLAGPVEVDEELRAIMSMPLVGHRSAGFLDEVKAVCQKLQGLFLTSAPALFDNCSATALMDAAVRNLVPERSLHLVNGAFSGRWRKSSVACGRTADAIEVAWGEVVTPDRLRKKLAADGPYDAVAITHSETSTGALSPLRELAEVVREVAPDTLVMVDAVSSLAGAELRFDEWGLDLVFAGTQKCLALPPGLCVFAVSNRALERAAGIPDRGLLADFPATAKALADGKTPATPCVPLVYALSRQLDRIATEGIENRWQRHRDMYSAVTTWAGEQGFEFLVEERYRSPTVSAIRNSGRDVKELIARAKSAGYTLGNGYGKLKGETFRVGHMGDHTPDGVKGLLAALEG